MDMLAKAARARHFASGRVERRKLRLHAKSDGGLAANHQEGAPALL